MPLLLLSPPTSELSPHPSSQRGLPEARSHLQDRSERRHTALDTGVQQIRKIMQFFSTLVTCAKEGWSLLMLFEYISYLKEESSFFYLLIHHVSKSNQQ